MAASPAPSSAPPEARPLFAGYALVAVTLAWLAGSALRALDPLAALPPLGWLLFAILAAVAAGIVARRRVAPSTSSRIALAVLVLLCALALGGARSAWGDPATDAYAIGHLPMNTQMRLRGEVAAEPDVRGGLRHLLVGVSSASLDGGHTWQQATGRAEVTVYGPDDWFAPAYGDTLSLNGTLTAVRRGVPAGALAEMQGAQATILARGGGNPLLAALFAIRLRLAEAIQRTLPEPEAALLIGILLGFKTPVLRSRLSLFTATGTIHLVVPAGLKVALLAEMARQALRPLGRWPRLAGSLAAVGVYAALGGGGPAAVRAAVMGALLVLGGSLGRRYNVYTALALAVLLMTVNEPLLIYDAGFQLTTLATLGIPLLTPTLQRLLIFPLGRLGALGAGIAESLAVTMAAQIATLPVLALTFGEISLIAPIANLVTVPLLAPLLILGGLLAVCGATGFGVLGGIALALSWVVWPLLWYVNNAIAVCAALPGAALAVVGAPLIVAWAYYAALSLGGWRLAPLLRRWSASLTREGGHPHLGRGAMIALLAVALLGAAGASTSALAASRTAHLDVFDVGPGGAATLLRLPSGVTVLIDGGPDGPTLESALGGRLPFWQHTLDLAILTDAHAGAVRGLEDAATHFTVTRAVDAGSLHPTREYLAWRDAMSHAGATYTQVRQGSQLHLDVTTTLTVLSPPQTLYTPRAGVTTASNDLILRLDTPGLRALLLGAADDYALDALAHSGQPLSADVVELALVPGEALDLSGALGDVLRLAHPRLIVIADAPVAPDSVAARRRVHGATWTSDGDAATALGALIYRTSEAGTISLGGDGNGWNLGG